MEAVRLLRLLLLLVLPVAVQAQYIYTTNNGAITINGYTASGGFVTIPNAINGLPVTCIGSYAFSGISLTNVMLPNGVTSIGDHAFYSCVNLVSITIPNSVTDLGDSAFYFCSSLSSITIPDSVTRIASNMFVNCVGLTNVALGSGVTNIGDYAFDFCSSLSSLTIPNSVTSIGDHAFYGCGLKAIDLPTSVSSIGSYAFASCGLTSVVLPNGVTALGNSVFSSTYSLTNIALPASLSSIGAAAFPFCGRLGAITVDALNPYFSCVDGILFDKNQTTLIQYPGGKAGGFTVPNTLKVVGSHAFAGCGALTSVTIPGSVIGIGDYAFHTCTNLTRIAIPDSVTSIGRYAFNSCKSVTTMTIGNGVTNVGDYAFEFCNSVSNVFFKGNAPSSVYPGLIDDAIATSYYLPGTIGWGATYGGRPAVLWNPRAQSSGGSFGVRTNRFGFNIAGTSNLVVVVEATSSLSTPVWQVVGTNTLTGGSSYFSDAGWTNASGRFYRIRSP